MIFRRKSSQPDKAAGADRAESIHRHEIDLIPNDEGVFDLANKAPSGGSPETAIKTEEVKASTHGKKPNFPTRTVDKYVHISEVPKRDLERVIVLDPKKEGVRGARTEWRRPKGIYTPNWISEGVSHMKDTLAKRKISGIGDPVAQAKREAAAAKKGEVVEVEPFRLKDGRIDYSKPTGTQEGFPKTNEGALARRESQLRVDAAGVETKPATRTASRAGGYYGGGGWSGSVEPAVQKASEKASKGWVKFAVVGGVVLGAVIGMNELSKSEQPNAAPLR